MLGTLFTTPISLGLAQATITTLLAIIVLLVARKQSIHIEREVIIALLRGITQITLVGSLLFLLIKSPAWSSIPILLIMFLIAGFTSAQQTKDIRGSFVASFTGIALSSGLVIGLMSWLGVIELSVMSLVPVGSMIIAAAMNSNALALNRFRAELQSHLGLIETSLALGASPKTTMQPYVRASVQASLIPRIDSLKTLGIVWIPGLMTGMILTGTDPVYAAIYQFVVMGMIFATSGLASMITIALIQKRVFTNADQLSLVPAKS